MIDVARILLHQGRQTLPDVSAVTLPAPFRGRPEIAPHPCADGCTQCADACPTAAIALDPVRLDLARCVFCGACEAACPEHKIHFTPDYRTATNTRERLVIAATSPPEVTLDEAAVREEIRDFFGASLKLRQVSAGGCNGCEMELGACGNVNFDMGRFGVEFVASPRLVITGPVTRNMAEALSICHDAVPAPRIVILTGACALSGGIFREGPANDRHILDAWPVDLFVPGCPPHPLTFINGVLTLIRHRTLSTP